jgi:hypothetical protein
MTQTPEGKFQRGRSKVSIRDLMDAGLLHEGETLFFSIHPEIQANVMSDGNLEFKGAMYNSPSRAALAARGISVNGWVVWKTRNSDGELISIGTLRERLQNSK